MRGKPVEYRVVRGGAMLNAAAFLTWSMFGCQSPLDSPTGEPTLKQVVDASIDREIAALEAEVPTLQTAQPPGEVEAELAERLDELETIAPATSANPIDVSLELDLAGAPQQTVAITSEAAIATAVQNNLAVQAARYQPAINREDVINAEAAFDFVLFGNVDVSKIDQPQATPVIMGVPIGTPFNASETYRFETGVSKRLYSGGTITASTDLTRFRNNSSGIEFEPDPAYTGALRLGMTQPLLRGFGSDVNKASIRLAENTEESAVQQLRSDLLNLTADTESAYWDLVLAWRALEIQQWLVNVGAEVRDVLGRRRDFDTRLAEYADAVAVVEQRKADVISARRSVRAASDALKRLMNDAALSVGSEAVLKPTEAFVATPIDYNLREIILTAIENRPEIEQAVLGIDDASILQLVADNARLPLLNVGAEVAWFGLDNDAGGAYSDTFDNDFVDYLLGLQFEYPIGNRAAEADFRSARLRRGRSMVDYRRTVQEIVLDVKAALRDVITSYELIGAGRSNRIAQAENLRAIRVEEETLAGLTPEFLNLKFQRQERLALARFQEIQALAEYDRALASLYRAMGTGLTVNNIQVEVVSDPYEKFSRAIEDYGEGG